jgi:cystathionine gamma-lyase
MSPCLQRPIELGADIVMHSITKYLNGHSDVLMGALAYSEWGGGRLQIAEGMSLHERLRFLQNSIGAVPGPFDCWLVLRGIKTLAVRMQRIQENSMAIAQWLTKHPRVQRVLYPGLAGHPNHELAKEQASGFGGMISFEIDADEAGASDVLAKLRLFAIAESLGGVESLAEHPAIMTHASVPKSIRAELGITEGLIRLSIGIESARDLIADLDQALGSH